MSFAGANVRSYEHPQHYAQAAQWVHDFIAKGLPVLPPRHIFGINIPDVEQIKGAQVTYQGRRAQSKTINAAMLIRVVGRCTGLGLLERR